MIGVCLLNMLNLELTFQLPVLPTVELKTSEQLLRRAHHVLAWVMHFYINTLTPDEALIIPRPISIPLLCVSQYLALPPLLTYSDDVLYNWTYLRPPTPVPSVMGPFEAPASPIPTIDNLKCQTLFTSTVDEQEFYLASARIELRGVEALELMRSTMDEAFVGDNLAIRRIASFLTRLAAVIRDMTVLLLAVRDGCDPEVFYNDIRPWFKGEDSKAGERKWIFEGIEDYPELKMPTELSGPSAGQSSIIHALDVFLGVDQYSHSHSASPSDSRKSFLDRMQSYMPRHHRAFLDHLKANPRPLRSLVETASEQLQNPTGDVDLHPNEYLMAGYNAAVQALKEFRDAHLKIVALYIVGPARKVHSGERKTVKVPATTILESKERETIKGTGGTDLMPFLKSVRDATASARIP